MQKIRKRIFEIIEAGKENDYASKTFDFLLICLIIVNVMLVISDTFLVSEDVRVIFIKVEIISVIIFTIEYALRIWTADFLYPDRKPIKARLKYIFSFMALIDLFAILPFYIPFLIPIDLRVLRALRIVRLFRLFKINRYTTAINKLTKVFRKTSYQLLSSMFIVFLLMIITSVIMYNVENAAQPDVFENAFSGMWWAVATLTTVGYGDIYPITAIGKLLSAIIALLGIGLVAVPTGIISAGFMECINDEKENDQKHFCPYCGKNIDG